MALTLRQIVDMADKRVPNSETDTDKIAIINQLQLRLYRQFDFPEDIEKILTKASQALYTLPSYIKVPRIKSLVVTDADGGNPKEYTKLGMRDKVVDYGYFAIESENSSVVGLTTTPDVSGKLIIINFEDEANTLSSANMATIPRFIHDYHMLFVYGLTKELAKIRKDVVLANNNESDFRELLDEALYFLNDSSFRQVRGEW